MVESLAGPDLGKFITIEPEQALVDLGLTNLIDAYQGQVDIEGPYLLPSEVEIDGWRHLRMEGGKIVVWRKTDVGPIVLKRFTPTINGDLVPRLLFYNHHVLKHILESHRDSILPRIKGCQLMPLGVKGDAIVYPYIKAKEYRSVVGLDGELKASFLQFPNLSKWLTLPIAHRVEELYPPNNPILYPELSGLKPESAYYLIDVFDDGSFLDIQKGLMRMKKLFNIEDLNADSFKEIKIPIFPESGPKEPS